MRLSARGRKSGVHLTGGRLSRVVSSGRNLAMTSEEAKGGVVLSEAERIHDAGGGETVRGGPLHRLGRGGGSRGLNHGRTVGVSRVIVRVNDVEWLRLRVLDRTDGISVIQETCAGGPHRGWIIRIGERCR